MDRMEGSLSRSADQVAQVVENFPADASVDDLRLALESFRSKELRSACTKLQLKPQSHEGRNHKDGYIDLLCEFRQDGKTVARTDQPPQSPKRSYFRPEQQQDKVAIRRTDLDRTNDRPEAPQHSFFRPGQQDEDDASRTDLARANEPQQPRFNLFRIAPRPDVATIRTERHPKRARRSSLQDNDSSTEAPEVGRARVVQDDILEQLRKQDKQESGATHVADLALAIRNSTEAIQSLRQTGMSGALIEEAEQKLKLLILKWISEMEKLGKSS